MQKIPSQKDLDTVIKQYKAGKFDIVEKLSISLTKEYPNHPFGWKALGIALKQKGKMSEALVVNKKVLEIDPMDPEGNYNIGNTLKNAFASQQPITETLEPLTISSTVSFMSSTCERGINISTSRPPAL